MHRPRQVAALSVSHACRAVADWAAGEHELSSPQIEHLGNRKHEPRGLRVKPHRETARRRSTRRALRGLRRTDARVISAEVVLTRVPARGLWRRGLSQFAGAAQRLLAESLVPLIAPRALDVVASDHGMEQRPNAGGALALAHL